MFISEEDIKQFSEDGAVVLRKVFSDDWVEKVKAGIEENLASPSEYSERLAVREGEVSGMTGEEMMRLSPGTLLQRLLQLAADPPVQGLRLQLPRRRAGRQVHGVQVLRLLPRARPQQGAG